MVKPVQIERRKPLNRAQYLHLFMEQDGLCGCGCGVKLNPLVEPVIDEHVIPLEQTGKNELRNRALYRKPCSDQKNKKDAKDTAKCKRLAGETCTGPTQPIPQRVNPWPAKGSRKLSSRPFADARGSRCMSHDNKGSEQ